MLLYIIKTDKSSITARICAAILFFCGALRLRFTVFPIRCKKMPESRILSVNKFTKRKKNVILKTIKRKGKRQC